MPISNPAAAPWPQVPAESRRARRTGIAILGLAALLVLAAWTVPPMLDWGRFRTAIASIAGAELGRRVVIGGDVALRLLPQAVLTATDVTLPDGGDGMSARIASLRLEVALGPLLAGRLVVRDLVLGSPVVTLPWPLPAGIVDPARPRLPHAFAAHLENGTLRAGQAEITAIDAAIHGGPEPEDGQEAGPVATFGAEGFAAFDGQRWRFTTALGAPDADGVSAVDLRVFGQGAAHDTGGTIQGTLSEGVLQGRLHASGPDLSLLIPASALAWTAEAPFVASRERIESPALTLSLGGAPASASLTLQLAPPTRLDAHLLAASLDLDGWARLFSGKVGGFSPAAIPMRLDVSADSGNLLGGTLGGLSGDLLFDGGHASIENAQAVLPGGALLHFSGRIEGGLGAGLSVEGPATLEAPDLHATLAWLHGLAPPLFEALPDAVLRTASLGGMARLAPGRLTIGQMSGQLDDARISGSVDLVLGAHPHVAAVASFDHLALDNWFEGVRLRPGMPLQAAAKPFTTVESSLRVSAASAVWRGQTLSGVELDATTGAGGLKIRRANAAFPNGSVALSGALSPDGRLAGVRMHVATQDVAKLAAMLPAALLPPQWRLPAGALHGPAELAAAGEGPSNAMELQARLSASDLVLEAEQRRDSLTGTADTTLTLRHPGAPFLLEALGYKGADSWIGAGSMAFLAHLHSLPGFASLQDFSLDAADLHMRGRGTLAYGSAEPEIRLDLTADELPLPDLAGWRGARLAASSLPAGWWGHAHVAASAVAFGLRREVEDLAADLTVMQGNLFVEVAHAKLAGGALTARAAIDATQKPVVTALQAELTKSAISGPLTGWPVDIVGGAAGLDADLMAHGSDAASVLGSMSGDAHVSLRNGLLSGLNLTELDRLFVGRSRPSRAALLGALTAGETEGLSGAADLVVDQGRASLSGASLSSTEGSLSIAGSFDFPSRKVDLSLGVTQAVPQSRAIVLQLAGAGGEVKSSVDLRRFDHAPRKPSRRAKHAS